jgi:hypothetical protein
MILKLSEDKLIALNSDPELMKKKFLDSRKKIHVHETLSNNAVLYHSNYITYLELCYANHYSITITPDIIWYTILNEVISLIKQSPEDYRLLFSNSTEKQEIKILSHDLVVMPLNKLSEVLKNTIPTDSSIYFPKFDTFTKNSEYAFQAAFCDMCSPYYNYSMYLCGFPYINIKGTLDDWKMLKLQWEELSKNIKSNQDWIISISIILNNIITQFDSIDFWKNMFLIKNCGSGHQSAMSGWFINLFLIKPSIAFSENFATHISSVKYKQLNTNKQYEMNVGLFNSEIEDEFMVPSFSSIIYEVKE